MKLFQNREVFLDIAGKFSSIRTANAIILPFGLERSVSYGRGTSRGPDAIIRASHEVELFDEELGGEPYRKFGIATLAKPKISKKSGQAIKDLENIVSRLLAQNKFPLILGGEHTLTIGAVRAVLSRFSPLTILHFDAHADLRDSYQGNKLSHACVMRRCFEMGNINLAQVGIRNISNNKEDGGEYDFYQKNKPKIKIFWAKDFKKLNKVDFLKNLGKYVYVSFDVDALDPSIMPSTGTPEPGGLGWYEVLDLIKSAAVASRIVGADIVELSPMKGLAAPDFLTAKLAYKILSYCHS